MIDARALLLSCTLCPGAVLAQACGTFFVDSNTPTGNLAKAISDVNSSGCSSGGLNTIIIDNQNLAATVIANPLPQIERPVQIQMFSPSSGRHPIRSNNSSQTAVNFALRANARVHINDLLIQGESGRAFFGGILLLGAAHDSQIRGVRIENVRHQGIFINGVDNAEIRRSNNHAVEIVNSGWGLNADNLTHQPAILINAAVNTTIYGSFLGMELDGTPAGNCTYGIEVAGSTGVFIGSMLSSINLRNHIGSNNYGGIRIRDSVAVSVFGNYLGLASNGQSMPGNGFGGCFGGTPGLPRGAVVISNSQLVAVGGGEGQGNVLVANFRGVVIDSSDDISVRRNLIGQRPSGQSGSNVGDAIQVLNGAGQNGPITIGGSSEAANVIRGAVSSGIGVLVAADAGRVEIRRNSLWGHPGGAIARPGLPDPPVLLLADAVSGTVTGSLTPVANAGEIDFYADAAGQGRWYLGTLAVTAGSSSFNTVLSSPEFVAGRQLSASFTRLGTPTPGSSRLSAALNIGSSLPDPIFASDFEAL